jgi:2-methylisocitrate lyase-like PEP mutase family enzyme
MTTQSQNKATVTRFADLHRGPTFVLANAWDAGSAAILERSGAVAIGTSSAALASTLNREDGRGQISREEALANAALVMSGTQLPVSADLENGYGREPEECAETIRQAIAIGLAGASIEDLADSETHEFYELPLAVDRIRAAVSVVRSSNLPFTLTARAEGLLPDGSNLGAIIERLQAFEAAGADVLFAPGVETREQIRRATSALTKPLNVLLPYSSNLDISILELQNLGVRRISLGSGLFRAGLAGMEQAARTALAGEFPYGLSARKHTIEPEKG